MSAVVDRLSSFLLLPAEAVSCPRGEAAADVLDAGPPVTTAGSAGRDAFVLPVEVVTPAAGSSTARVASASAAPVVPERSADPADTGDPADSTGPTEPARRAVRRRRRRSSGSRHPAAAPPAVAIVGDAATTALAVAVAGGVARRHRSAVALTTVWGDAAPSREGTSSTRAAALLASDIEGATDLAARATGSGVVVQLPQDGDIAVAHRLVTTLAGQQCAQVLVVTGPRPPALDAVLAGYDVLVALVAADAPEALVDVAAASLRSLAPDAQAVTVSRPVGGLPRLLRQRATVRQILRVLDA
ncbi:hypothetical protein DSM112329_01714 [Paraconexibacter sp. AEG42_29]|uniref:Uncharacterized protein n=1 Tax=Paraconexibacter sp. AEG42_29 TaxID=2997339 RepID=A0AAU7AT60_9ACTN